jgi:hypothetical protein
MGIGAAIGALVGLGKGLFGHKPNASEKLGEKQRGLGQSLGIFTRADKSHPMEMQLADGSLYNIEQEVYKPAGGSSKGTRGSHFDPNMKYSNIMVGMAAPIAIIANQGEGEKEGEASAMMTGYLFNGANSNAGGDPDKFRQNILAVYERNGLTAEDAKQALQQLRDQGAITPEECAVYEQNVDLVFNGSDNYAETTYQQVYDTLHPDGAQSQAGEQGSEQGSEPPDLSNVKPAPRPIVGSDGRATMTSAPSTSDSIPSSKGLTKADYEDLVRQGKYRRGSAKAGGYVNNATNEWVGV